MAELTLILNFIIIFLLITAIMYGFVLNKRIRLIRESGRELSNLFRSFDDTILRAEVGIEELKKVSNQVAMGLQKDTDKAALMLNELEFVTEKAVKAAQITERAIQAFKQIEGKLPLPQRPQTQQNIVQMPQLQTKSPIPVRPQTRPKNLSDLLEEVSVNQKRPVAQGARPVTKVAAQPLASAENKNIDKKQFSIASALKALGYGD